MINKHFSEPAHYRSPNFDSDITGVEAKQISCNFWLVVGETQMLGQLNQVKTFLLMGEEGNTMDTADKQTDNFQGMFVS